MQEATIGSPLTGGKDELFCIYYFQKIYWSVYADHTLLVTGDRGEIKHTKIPASWSVHFGGRKTDNK